MSFAAVEPLVRAVLYEGYVLYPYRPSSLKNRHRFTFGGVYPRAWSEANGGDPWSMKTECLARGEGARVTIAVRFLQVSEQGAVERTVDLPERALGAYVSRPEIERFAFEALRGEIEIRAARVEVGVHRVTVEIRNVTPFSPPPDTMGWRDARDAALRHAFVSTHTLLSVQGGELVSLLDPPEALREAAAACQNVGTWPVLAGEEGRHDVMLSSPIILEDHPRIAPESPGDLFDATEIDEMLTLRILTLTDEEKAEVRAGDSRARAILDRALALGPEALARLHGTARSDLRPGDRVRLRPAGRADVMDLALAGMDATIASVEEDDTGRLHFAVTVDADPGRDLGLDGQPGHRFFFRREELERLS